MDANALRAAFACDPIKGGAFTDSLMRNCVSGIVAAFCGQLTNHSYYSVCVVVGVIVNVINVLSTGK